MLCLSFSNYPRGLIKMQVHYLPAEGARFPLVRCLTRTEANEKETKTVIKFISATITKFSGRRFYGYGRETGTTHMKITTTTTTTCATLNKSPGIFSIEDIILQHDVESKKKV